jgi:WD40 repeat protein
MRIVPLPSSNEVGVTTCDGMLVREDLTRRSIIDRLRVGATASSLARHGDMLAVGTSTGVTIVDARRWVVQKRIRTTFPVNALGFSPTGRHLALAAPDRVAVLTVGGQRQRILARTNTQYDELLNVAWAGRHTILVGGFDIPPQNRVFATGLAAIDTRTGHAQPVRLDGGSIKPLALGTPGRSTSNVEGIAVQQQGRGWFFAGKVAPSATLSGGHAEVWRVNPRTRRVVWRSKGPVGQYATSVAVSPDGRRLIVGYGTGLAAVLDARTGEPVVRLPGHTTAVRGLLFRGGAAPVVTASQDGVVRTWAGQGTEEARTTVPPTVLGLSYDHGSFVGIGGGGHAVFVNGHGRVVRSRAAIPADAIEYSWSLTPPATVAYVRLTRNGAVLTVRDVASGDIIGRPSDYTLGSLMGVGASGRVLTIYGVRDSSFRARLFDPRTGASRSFAPGPTACLGGGGGAEFSPDESRAVVYDNCGLVSLYDVRSGRLLHALQIPDRTTANGVGWAPDSSKVYLGAAGGSLVAIDVATGQFQERPGSQEAANTVSISPDGRFVALGGSRGIVDVYDTRTLQLVRQHVLPRPVEAVSLGRDTLAVLDQQHTVRAWDTCAVCENAAALERRMRAETVRRLTPGERATFGV